MTAGRRPKPTKLKILTGNPGKRPLNKKEPQPAGALPKPPVHLDKLAKKTWKTKASQAPWLTAADAEMLEVFCESYSVKVRLDKDITREGEVLTRNSSGDSYQNPKVVVRNQASDRMVKAATLLGLDPSSRSRLHTAAPQTECDKLEAFLEGAG